MNVLFDDNEYGDSNWLSTCCGCYAWGELYDGLDGETKIGICLGCKDHATFTKDKESI